MEESEIERGTPWPALILSVALPANDVHALHEWQQALYKAVEAAAMERAANILQLRALMVAESNPGRQKGTVSQVGEFGIGVLSGAWEAIRAAAKKEA